MMKKTFIISMLTTTLTLSGCAGAIIGGAAVAGGAAFATLHDRRTPGTVVDDKNLEVVITKKLIENKNIDENSHTNLTIYNGVVLVTGEAKSQSIVRQIVALIKPLPKVKSVEATLAIGPSSSLLSRANDAAITGKVKVAVAGLKLPKFDTTLINVSTERGNVYLMGLVSRAEGSAIVETSRYVTGVKSVTSLFEYLD